MCYINYGIAVMKRIICLAFIFLFASPAFASSTFTQEQKGEIGKIASDYLIEHPKFLIEASKKLQQQQMQDQQRKVADLIIGKKPGSGSIKQLLDTKATPWTGNGDGDVAIIEFFDYQCMFCSKVNPAFELLEKSDKNVKFIFKDYPIFGSQWAASNYAANVGVKAFNQGGSMLYQKYHNQIFDSGKNEGKLKISDVNKVAQKLSIKLGSSKVSDKVHKVDLISSISENMKLGEKLQAMGTPFIIVLPVKGATVENMTVFSGYPANPQGGTKAAVKALQKAIEKARKK